MLNNQHFNYFEHKRIKSTLLIDFNDIPVTNLNT